MIIKDACKGEFYKLMQDKYGHHLASVLYNSAFDPLEKKAVQDHILNKIEKYVMHMYASDFIEEMYKGSKLPFKNQMFEAIFGAKLQFLKVFAHVIYNFLDHRKNDCKC